MTPKNLERASGRSRIGGDYLVRFEARTLDDIRALGTNSLEDERKFAAAARLSEINLGLYKALFQPWVRLWANEGAAEWMQRLHPARMQYEMFSHENPLLRPLDAIVANAKAESSAGTEDNPFLQAQKFYSDWITTSLDAYRDVKRQAVGGVFPRRVWFADRAGHGWPERLCGRTATQTRARI